MNGGVEDNQVEADLKARKQLAQFRQIQIAHDKNLRTGMQANKLMKYYRERNSLWAEGKHFRLFMSY